MAIVASPATFTGDAPVADLMQGTGEEAVRENDPMQVLGVGGGTVQGFIVTAHQAGAIRRGEDAVEQGDDIVDTVIHAASFKAEAHYRGYDA